MQVDAIFTQLRSFLDATAKNLPLEKSTQLTIDLTELQHTWQQFEALYHDNHASHQSLEKTIINLRKLLGGLAQDPTFQYEMTYTKKYLQKTILVGDLFNKLLVKLAKAAPLNNVTDESTLPYNLFIRNRLHKLLASIFRQPPRPYYDCAISLNAINPYNAKTSIALSTGWAYGTEHLWALIEVANKGNSPDNYRYIDPYTNLPLSVFDIKRLHSHRLKAEPSIYMLKLIQLGNKVLNFLKTCAMLGLALLGFAISLLYIRATYKLMDAFTGSLTAFFNLSDKPIFQSRSYALYVGSTLGTLYYAVFHGQKIQNACKHIYEKETTREKLIEASKHVVNIIGYQLKLTIAAFITTSLMIKLEKRSHIFTDDNVVLNYQHTKMLTNIVILVHGLHIFLTDKAINHAVTAGNSLINHTYNKAQAAHRYVGSLFARPTFPPSSPQVLLAPPKP